MSDTYSGSPSPDPVSVPDSPSSEPSSCFGHPVDLAVDPVVNEKRHAVLDQLSRSEDITDFVRERRDQTEVMDKGKPIPEERQRQWFRRASKALSDAEMEAAGLQSNGLYQEKPEYIPQNARSNISGTTKKLSSE